MKLEVIEANYRFANINITELEAWTGTNHLDSNTPTVIIPVGTIVETLGKKDVDGSCRVVFKKEGDTVQYQSFWNDFRNFTKITELANGKQL